jgi:hypothetical protein
MRAYILGRQNRTPCRAFILIGKRKEERRWEA